MFQKHTVIHLLLFVTFITIGSVCFVQSAYGASRCQTDCTGQGPICGNVGAGGNPAWSCQCPPGAPDCSIYGGYMCCDTNPGVGGCPCTAGPTPTPTPTPMPGCGRGCTLGPGDVCPTIDPGLVCTRINPSTTVCRNSGCDTQPSCVCPGPTPTPTPSPGAGTCTNVCDATTDDCCPGFFPSRSGSSCTCTGANAEQLALFSIINGIMLPIVIIVGMFIIVLAGYKILTSQGNPQELQTGKENLTSAIIGLIFVLMAVSILRVIIKALITGDQDPF